MPLFTKNGSIPKPQTDGTEGWVLVPSKPIPPEGKEVVWLNWEWVVRDPMPEIIPGSVWKWNADGSKWISYMLPIQLSAVPGGVGEVGTAGW